jgi:hypothetical protein
MRCINSSIAHFTHCTFACDSTGADGGGIELYDGPQITMDNCIIAFSIDGEAIHLDQSDDPVSATLACCDLYGNEGGDWIGDIAAQYGINGNISEDPLFCGGCSGNYYLAGCSPCLHQPCGPMGAYGRGCFGPAPNIIDITDVGNDQGRQVRIIWERSIYDASGDTIDITGYGVYRRQDQYLAAPGGPPLTTQESPGSGVMLMLAGWDYVDYVPARGDSAYQYVAPTLCDSTAVGGICWSTFFISAMTSDPLVYFDSYPDSGYSVDNLAPSTPCGFTGDGDGSDIVVQWQPNDEEDLCRYRVYRGATEEFDISEALSVYETCDTTAVIDDLGGDPCEIFYYRLTATDFSGNESDPTPAIPICAQSAGVDIDGEPVRFALFGGRPNPFTEATAIAFSIPVRQHVRLEVFDVNGRFVARLVDWELDAGHHRAEWDGTNSNGRTIPAGIYFSRLESGGKQATVKMILAK